MVRVLSGAVLAVAAVAAILWLPAVPLRVVTCAVAGLAAREYVRLAGVASGPSRVLVAAAVIAMCWLVSSGTPLDGDALVAGTLLWVGVEVLFFGHAIQQAAAGVVAPAYLGAPLGMVVAIRALGGWQATLLLLATVVVSDSAQYYSGRAFGRHRLAPAISPKKTIEGAAGGLIVATAFIVVAGPFVFATIGPGAFALLGVVMVVLGIGGDLFESRLKRAAGVKDSAALIPGHGGVLDRVDALLFATPAFYLFLRLYVGLSA